MAVELGVVGDDHGGGVAAEAGDDELAHGAGVVRSARTVDSCTRGRLCGPGRSRVIGLVVAGVRALIWRTRAGERIRRVRKLMPRCVEFGEHRLGGDLLVHDQQVRVGAADVLSSGRRTR